MRIGIYARVSTKDKGQETENQLFQLRDFCKRQSWTIVREFIDQASAVKKRPQFEELFAAASRRELDIVLFWSLDRFSRSGVLETLKFLQELNGYGVNWRSFTEQYLDSCGIFRDAVLSILATIAKQERVRISERTLAGLARARRQGTRLGRPAVICNRDQIREMHREGTSLGKVAAHFGLKKSTVARICAA